jgi:predicted nucleic acid-binding protein
VSLVVDASVVVKWFVQEPGHAAATGILEGADPLLAPDIVVPETLNVLWKKQRRGEVTDAQVAGVLNRLEPMLDEIVPSLKLAAQAYALAGALDHPVYDCLYLACAGATNSTLVTADEQFARKARGAGVAAVRILGDLSYAPSSRP